MTGRRRVTQRPGDPASRTIRPLRGGLRHSTKPIVRGGDESGPDRIELDVAEDGPEVGVVHGGTVESALPKMA